MEKIYAHVAAFAYGWTCDRTSARTEFLRVVRAAHAGTPVVLVVSQTRQGAYNSEPSSHFAEILAHTYGAERWLAEDDLLRPYYDNGHGEGARNLEALAALIRVGVRPEIEVEYV